MKNEKNVNRLTSLLTLGALVILVMFTTNCVSAKSKPKVLIFTKTAGYHHESIGVGTIAIMKLGAKSGFDADSTSDASKFTESNLKQYAAVIFLSTTHDVLDDAQQKSLYALYRSRRRFCGYTCSYRLRI